MKGTGSAVRAGREDMGDFADEAGVSAAYCSVVDDRAAQALAQVEVGEVVELRVVGGLARHVRDHQGSGRVCHR
jgi:hypothetical protein